MRSVPLSCCCGLLKLVEALADQYFTNAEFSPLYCPPPSPLPSPTLALSLGAEVLLQPEAVQAHKLLNRFRAVVQTRQIRLALVGHSLRG